MSKLDSIEKELLDLYEFHNGNISQIANKVETSRQNVHNWFKKRGKKGSGIRLTVLDVAIINSGKLTVSELCERLNSHRETIIKHIETKLPHGNMKYSDEEIKNTLIKTNGNILQASKILNMHQPVLFRLLKNRKINAKDYKLDTTSQNC